MMSPVTFEDGPFCPYRSLSAVNVAAGVGVPTMFAGDERLAPLVSTLSMNLSALRTASNAFVAA
ncbi:hypothetical protein D7W81_10780 [Corallococcus aberystwythensis]|uniref:Uncharacterized protein n=1 Tax=Corallococcus aberystwythensis TaxID=2316722 RepID=A0A3A8QLN2_9BACT|nr:hypothetical protein D7W81_10780 [Corallococcus aberystwythensis]